MIDSHFQNKISKSEVAEIIECLKSRGIFSLEGNKVKCAA
jgi:hypothetical protein